MNKEQFDKDNVFGLGKFNEGFKEYFSGESFLNPLTNPKECPLFLANVTFEPGCRNNWHIHHAETGSGQILICTGCSNYTSKCKALAWSKKRFLV